MIDKEKVIEELMQLHGSKETITVISDAVTLLKTTYTPEEARCVLVSHGQQDKRFGWGEVIKYSPSEVQEILEEAINESVAE